MFDGAKVRKEFKDENLKRKKCTIIKIEFVDGKILELKNALNNYYEDRVGCFYIETENESLYFNKNQIKCFNIIEQHIKNDNYNKIKNMSVREMAEFLNEIGGSWICKNKRLTICDECKEDVAKCDKDFAVCMYEQYLLQEIEENEKK